MPIPTDTYWNIKRLNVVFALSALLLLAVTGWAIIQDYGKDWRVPQRQARVWEAALVDDKLRRQMTDEQRQQLQELDNRIAQTQQQLIRGNDTYRKLVAQRKELESRRATIEFELNNLKSEVQVMESNLQDAIAADNRQRVQELTAALVQPRRQVAEWSEQLASLAGQISELRRQEEAQTAAVDALKKQRAQLSADAEALRKKLISVDPKRQGGLRGLVGGISSQLRDAPLLGFINPSERVQQVVLPDIQTDVAFMKITTIDRCMTCHVNIANKDFTVEKVEGYLEEQLAVWRKLNLPERASGRAADPSATASAPGAVAMPEFWHAWAGLLAPELIRKNSVRLTAVTRNVGNDKPISVRYDGQVLAEFKYDPAATDPAVVARQNEILLALLDVYYRWSKGAAVTATRGRAVATISPDADERAITTSRNMAMRYAEELKAGLAATLQPDLLHQLQQRYRQAMTDELNIARQQQGLPPLDPSPVLLAHPNLEFYVSVDSPHSFEAVGCTSCHDGSGQETDFVLAAHVPRDIYVDAKTGVPVLPAQFTERPAGHAQAHAFDLSDMLETAEHAQGLYLTGASTQPAQAGADHADRPVAYVDPVTGRRGKAISQMAWWKKIYQPKAPRSFELVYHEWDWPMRSRQYIEVNCARCHTEVYDIKETAPTLYEGRQLFTQLGCVNCHQMDSIPAYENRKVGTDLRHVTSKLSPQFINTWIWAPKAFRPTTKMPHFFMLENNCSDEELRRTRQEARAITEYLVRTATPLPPKHLYPPGGRGSPEAGKAIFETIGCLACHQNLNERGEQWITTDLVKRLGLTPDQAKQRYDAMDYNQRQLYVQQHLSEPASMNELPKYPDGSPRPVFVQVGPELSGIGTKLLAGRTEEQARQWLFDWLKEPNHYSSYTIMPRLRLSDQQAMDLVAYLLEQKRTSTDPDDAWKPGLTPIDRPKLIEITSLLLRSRFSAQTALAKADDDAELTELATAALTTPAKTAEQARAEVAGMSRDEKRLVFVGQRMIAHYGCMSCHAINGMETTTSPCTNLSDWGQKGVDKLDFGYLDQHKVHDFHKRGIYTRPVAMVNGLSAESSRLAHQDITARQIARPVELAWPEIGHNRSDWLVQKLKNPRIYDRGKALLEPSGGDNPGKPYDKLKMPAFYLNDRQVHAVATFVLSNRNRLISESLHRRTTHEQARIIARGRELTERYNCVSCHQIENNAPQIRQYFKLEDIATKAPPSLRGEGNKIQHAWLFNFFKHIQPLRPLLGEMGNGIRMPSFPASDQEWTAIIAYFNAVSQKESKQLGRQLDLIAKYADSKRKAATQPGDAQTAADDWWQRPELAQAARFLKQWGLTYGHIKPIEVGPTASAADLTKVYKTLLFKASFTRELYDAPYPFVDSPRPQISQERFGLGERFFYEMQCLKCHVLGDPSAPGATLAPTAPNLSLAYERLQQRWVRHWVQEPNIIQVGTAMPPFFTGLAVFRPQGQPWPASQGAAEQEVRRVEAIYGQTVEEQTALLLDFLYAAGARGYTGVQPAGATPAAAPTTSPSADAADWKHEMTQGYANTNR